MAAVIYLTKERRQEIEQELKDLQIRGRREIAQKIADARSHGDLSENADYDAAKDEQGLLELKISQLSKTLANSQVIDSNEFPSDKVYILSKVLLSNVDTGDEFEFSLVSAEEADFEQNKISITSPLGKALMGKAIGEIATLVTPRGNTVYKVLKIYK